MSIADKIKQLNNNNNKPLNILEFCESEYHINVKLFPVQKFIFKLIYSLPLSENLDEPIIIKDDFNEKIIKTFYSESEFLSYLYKNKYINSKSFDYPLTDVALLMGRRGTKTTMSSIMSSYMLYLICDMDDVHKYFRILPSTEIGIALVSNNKPNTYKQNRELTSMIYSSPFFKPFIVQKDPPNSGFTMLTKKHIVDKNCRDGKIQISTYACTPSVRGASNIMTILDEFAHYIDSEHSTKEKPLDKTLYDAITPSIAGFTDPVNGAPLGKSVIMTSVNGKKGETFKKHENARDDSSVLVFRVPSWWVNPNISPIYLKKKYDESVLSYQQEFMSMFVSGAVSAININKLEACRDLYLFSSLNNANKNIRHYASLDLALSNDGCSFAVCHYEKYRNRNVPEEYKKYVKNKEVYVYDFIHNLIPPDGNEDLDMDEIIYVVKDIIKFFNPRNFDMDKWSSAMFKQWLRKEKVNVSIFEDINVNSAYNSDTAKLFKLLLNRGNLIIPNEDYIFDQLKGIKEKVQGHYIKMENESGHDDIFNAMLKCLWRCYNDKNKGVVTNYKKIVQRRNKKHNHKLIASSLRCRDKSKLVI